MSTNPSPFGAGLQIVAATPAAGAALQNATPTFLSWTAPNDGQAHYVQVTCTLDVTVAETGGQLILSFKAPDGTAGQSVIVAASQGVGATGGTNGRAVQAGQTVTFGQGTALTAGTATVWAVLLAA